MTIPYEKYLEHYGVKGMKWGVRREERRAYSQTKKQYKTRDPRKLNEADQLSFQNDYERKLRQQKDRKSSDTRSADRKKYDATREKKIREMSDDELKAVLNRLNMEKQYKSLSRELYSPGKHYANKLLTTGGNIAIGAAAGYGINKVASPLITKAGKTVGKAILRRVIRR